MLNGLNIIGTGSPGAAGPDWTIAHLQDVNGDGMADILWRHSAGALYEWQLNGPNILGADAVAAAVGTDWQVQ